MAHSIELLLLAFTIHIGRGAPSHKHTNTQARTQQMGPSEFAETRNSLSAVWIKLYIWCGYTRTRRSSIQYSLISVMPVMNAHTLRAHFFVRKSNSFSLLFFFSALSTSRISITTDFHWKCVWTDVLHFGFTRNHFSLEK